MGMLKSFIKAVESMGEESADEKLEKSTEELLNSLHSDPNNSENRKKAAGLVISTMYTGYYGDAADKLGHLDRSVHLLMRRVRTERT